MMISITVQQVPTPPPLGRFSVWGVGWVGNYLGVDGIGWTAQMQLAVLPPPPQSLADRWFWFSRLSFGRHAVVSACNESGHPSFKAIILIGYPSV